MLDFRLKVAKEMDIRNHEMLLVFGEKTFQPFDESKTLSTLEISDGSELMVMKVPFVRNQRIFQKSMQNGM